MKKKLSSSNDAVGLILKAAQFAAHKHRYQKRKDKNETPYINHPLEVARVLNEEGGVTDPGILAAALLHDTIEDTQTTYVELRGQFGKRIADIVAEVTDTKSLGKRTRKSLQVAKAGRASVAAQQVKIADKVSNLRDILASPPADWTLERKQQYFDWAKLVVDEVRDANPALTKRFDKLYAHWARRRPGKAKSPQSERRERSGESHPVQLKLDARANTFHEIAKAIEEALRKAHSSRAP
jgi:guanosine-3',5'-bis(diphosphate) 3'-pyrophosphohydrolase